ncbi:hypothetical protein A2686_03850 [Candidatus Woesebacteria bacterium RIFCSPHIGHO2_01_FULL_38_10]|nr:MAG: hypothetical protein A2686_03850 [Candidatus Woesebacteria bacterium RIFCSPHIGHO2_01_FULL_38_10]
MAPILEGDTKLPFAQVEKFVRVKEVVAFDKQSVTHRQIATANGIGESSDDGRVEVDDAGVFGRVSDTKIIVYGWSSTCQLRVSDSDLARQKTKKVIEEITGKVVEII